MGLYRARGTSITLTKRDSESSRIGRSVDPATEARLVRQAEVQEKQTTAVVQRYLEELDGDAPAEPIVRELLDQSVRRLQVLCANLLYRGYPRLMQPPVNLQPDELLGAVVERLLKALRFARPRNVREFFALANQHMRWELNDLARRLDNQPATGELVEDMALSPPSSVSRLTP